MKSRGRPPKTVRQPRYPNRLRELRDRLGLSQQQIAAQAAISPPYYGALERGEKRINADTAQRLQGPLRCAAGELLAGMPVASVPLRYAIAAAESETRPASFELSEPYEWLQPGRRLAEPEGCFAAEIVDGSADLDFAGGTVLIIRPITQFAEKLPLGAKIVVRFLMEPGQIDNKRPTHEILYGILDQNILGDLVLVTRTRNRLVPRNALIQNPIPPGSGLSEAPLAMRPRGGLIDYTPRPEDPAEILGIVVYAAGPT
jgi:transcriptional regulator with XRE-family HTH domain